MELATFNREELVVTALLGEVTSPIMEGNPYEVTARGEPIVPVGTGGICYNVRVGMPARGWAGDQVEPGVSIANPADNANMALSVFACVGNRVTVRTGGAAGAQGTVTGKHEAFRAFQHVLVHLDSETLERLLPGDQLHVRACGRGMRVPALPGIACHSLGPELWDAWAPRPREGRLVARVAAVVPPELMGSGSGRLSAATSIEIQSTDEEMLRRHGLDALRLGDLVAVRDWDATYFTGYREGALTIGVVAHGDSRLSGHGPGLTILLSCSDGCIETELDSNANLATLLGLST
ncbi:MAG TPA: DUF4438 domain-containing protein [Chloroflexota bacterium]|jgi:hypothetical protein|nr:DUF4438 domain-containing protein [Chloroflexota bacterium]